MNRGTSSLEIEKMVYKLGKEHFIIINDFPYMNISSTMIREGSNKYLNIKVLNYIKNNHLYGR